MNWQSDENKGTRRVYFRYYRKIGPFFKKPRVRAYTMLILSLLTISFFGLFAIKPTLKTIFQLKREIADGRLVNQALEQKIIDLSQIKEEYQKIEEALPLISKALPSEPKFSFFLKDLENLAQAVGATISGVRLEKIDLAKKDLQSPTQISASLILTGNYSSCKNFLTQLLETSRLYAIEKFNISSRSQEGEERITLDLNINSYYFQSNSDVQ